jgi:hypothetical protein
VLGHAFASQGEELFEAAGCGDDRRTGIEGEALILVDVGPSARLVALLEQDRGESGCLQADREGESAEAAADDGDRGRRGGHDATPRGARGRARWAPVDGR